jgi:dGTPase
LATTRKNIAAHSPTSAAAIRNAATPMVGFSFDMTRSVSTLREFLHARMYRHSKVNRACARAQKIVKDLFLFFMQQPNCLPTAWFALVQSSDGDVAKARVIADYIAGMTDRYAIQEHRKLFSVEAMV